MTLLALALQLLIASQQPNVPQNLRFEAINLASQIVTYSQQVPVETTVVGSIEAKSDQEGLDCETLAFMSKGKKHCI